MKNGLRYAVLACLCGLSIAGYAKWSTDMYGRYDYTNYTNFAEFNLSPESGYDADLLEAAIFYETNRQRVLNGKPQFKYDYRLEVSAHNHSVSMVERNFFSHESPVSGMETMSQRIEAAGIDFQTAGENIAYRPIGSTYAETAKALLDQWMNSPGHRANILEDNFTHLGCGVAFFRGDYNVMYVKATQNFMRPWDEYRAAKNNSKQESSNQYSKPIQNTEKSPTNSQSQTVLTWTADEIYHANTGFGASYLTDLEKDVLMYINLARLYPKKFAAKEVERYQGPQGYDVYETFQEYKNSLIKTLNSMEPVKALMPDNDCYLLAYCWAEESGRLGIVGHNRVNCSKGYMAECCSYGVYTPIDIALQWLIDDPIPSLGHRKICLSPAYSKAGISFMKHSTEDHVTVLDCK